MREWSEDVLFGIMRLSSSLLVGRDSPERGLEANDGAMVQSSPELTRVDKAIVKVESLSMVKEAEITPGGVSNLLQAGTRANIYQTSCVQGWLHNRRLSQTWDPLSVCAAQEVGQQMQQGRRGGKTGKARLSPIACLQLATQACAPTVVEMDD